MRERSEGGRRGGTESTGAGGDAMGFIGGGFLMKNGGFPKVHKVFCGESAIIPY